MKKWLCVAFLCATASAAQRPEVIIYPQGMTPAILQSVNLALQDVVRLADDIDVGETIRLRSKARNAVLAILQTHGYFNAHVDLTVGTDINGETWEVSVQSGPRSVIHQVTNRFEGVVTEPRYATDRAKWQKEWLLPVGRPFLNSQWTEAKNSLLNAVSAKNFYFAHYTHTEALVHPQDHQVNLSTTIASGPVVSLGELQVKGLHYVPPSVIRHYVNYQVGQVYDRQQLNQWQEVLMSTNYFRGVFLTLNGQMNPKQQRQELPLVVQVTEAPRAKLVGTIAVNSDVGLRVEGMYQRHILFHYPVTLSTGFGIDRYEQTVFSDLLKPTRQDGTKDSFGALFKHRNMTGEDLQRVAIGWKRFRQFDKDQPVNYEMTARLNASYDWVKVGHQSLYNQPFLVGTLSGMRRAVDNVYNPRSGNVWTIGVGAGLGLRTHQPFARIDIQGKMWYPVGRRDVLVTHIQVGKVLASPNTLIPSDFGYRVGGSHSLRGYRFRQFGQVYGKAVIGARAMAVGGVQYIHYFNATWGATAFMDIGNVAPHLRQIKPVMGYGIGGLAKTPAGPFELSVAYGQEDHKFRLYFSLGVAL